MATSAFCIDMRVANKAIGQTRYPTPNNDDIMIKLKNAALFSKLDLTSVFHQLELTPNFRFITTFQTETRLKRFKRLNFGVNSAQEELQHALREVLHDINGVMNIADDIIIYANNVIQHDAVLNRVLELLHERGLTLNLRKCIFSKEKNKILPLHLLKIWNISRS